MYRHVGVRVLANCSRSFARSSHPRPRRSYVPRSNPRAFVSVEFAKRGGSRWFLDLRSPTITRDRFVAFVRSSPSPHEPELVKSTLHRRSPRRVIASFAADQFACLCKTSRVYPSPCFVYVFVWVHVRVRSTRNSQGYVRVSRASRAPPLSCSRVSLVSRRLFYENGSYRSQPMAISIIINTLRFNTITIS